MIIAHLADQHLGFNQLDYRYRTEASMIRTKDVFDAFERAVDGVLELKPQACILAGDLFHSSKPHNSTINFAFDQLYRLTEARIPTVLIAGNHDDPRTSATDSIFPLFRKLGVHVAIKTVEFFEFRELDLCITAVPHPALHGLKVQDLRPNKDFKYNVMTLHGEVQGAFKGEFMEHGGKIVSHKDLNEGWDYVALGHYHIQQQMAPRVWYAGSHEFVSTNIWGEKREEDAEHIRKGWLGVELDHGYIERHPVQLNRTVIDMDPIDCTDLTPQEVNSAIYKAVEQAGIKNNIVRMTLANLERSTAHQLDHAFIRKCKSTAIHFQTNLKRPDRNVGHLPATRDRGSLDNIVKTYLTDRKLPAGIDRAEFVQLGMTALTQTVKDE